MQHNDKDKALTLLKSVMDSSAPQALRSVATLSYVGHQLDTMESDQALALLQPLLLDVAFVVPATQLAFSVYMKANQSEQAEALVAKSLALPNLSNEAKSKLETLQTMIGH